MNKKELEIIIPIPIDGYFSESIDVVIERIMVLYNDYGYDRFALAAPCNGWLNFTYPPKEFYVEKAKMFAEIKEKVAPYGIKCGWWLFLSLKGGANSDFEKYVDIDGNKFEYTMCPLGEGFIKRISEDIATIAQIAKPEFIFIEDDYCIESGCFCEEHLNKFSKLMGRFYSREELKEYSTTGNIETVDIVRKWREFSKETMLDLSRAIRAEVNKESPEIHISPFQSGGCDFEGFSTEDHARILAGEGCTPSSRIYGAYYAYDFNGERLPETIFHSLYSKQHFNQNFKFLHETDTYPYTRFFISANEMKSMMAAVYSYGFDGSVFFSTPFTYRSDNETSYNKMFAKERKRFNALHMVAKNCKLKGVEISFDPLYYTLGERKGSWEPLWTKSLGSFGIPYTTETSNVAFWDKTQAKYADDETIKEYLSKGLFLDGDAAKILCKRGYGKYIGVEVGDEVSTGTGEFDQCSQEVIRDCFVEEGMGKYMPNSRMWNLLGNGVLYELKPIDNKCEIISELYTFRNEVLSPAMTRFENSLGGRIVVMGTTLENNLSQNLFNYQRQQLLQNLIKWCCDEYAFVEKTAKVFCITNEFADDEFDYKGMVTLINLSTDEYENMKIYLPERWRKCKEFLTLNIKGEWEELKYSRTDDGICLENELRNGHPVYILLK